jgi:hypothetical protein
MEIYIHSEGKEDPELVEVAATASVAELLVREPGVEEFIWVEEGDEPIAVELTLEAAGIRHRHHIHRGRCRRVEVKVRYNAEKVHQFAPSATVAKVFDWATGKKAFDLTADERAKHVLAVPGADHPLAFNVHIGSLVKASSCEVVLDLVPKVRFEG